MNLEKLYTVLCIGAGMYLQEPHWCKRMTKRFFSFSLWTWNLDHQKDTEKTVEVKEVVVWQDSSYIYRKGFSIEEYDLVEVNGWFEV